MSQIVKVDQSAEERVETAFQMDMRRQTEKLEVNRLKRKDREEEVATRLLEIGVRKQELDNQSREVHIKSSASDYRYGTINKFYGLYAKFKTDDDVIDEYGTLESHMAFQCRKEVENA